MAPPIVHHKIQARNRVPRRRIFDFVAGTLAGIGAIIAGHQLSKPTSVDTTRPIVDSSHSDFLDQFARSDFSAIAGRLRRMADVGNRDGVNDTLDELATMYVQVSQRAPSTAAASDLGQVALSEFTKGYTEGTHKGSTDTSRYYQEFLGRVRTKQNT